MSFFNNPFKQDTYHYFGKDKVDFKHLLKDHGYRYVFYLRQCQAGGWRKLIFSIPRKHLSLRHGIEISPEVRCGGGLYLGHPYGITVSTGAVLGMNVNLHKGCTIGREDRGKRQGYPTIGNCVPVGINATVVGRITVGDDVMIAAGSFVNRDVPSHSICIGNPCQIIPKEGATDGYIVNRVGAE